MKEGRYHPKRDLEFQAPYIDQDEWRSQPLQHRYVHGGFADTNVRFALYFPPVEEYKGRFFQHLSPVQGDENASQALKGAENRIGFSVSHGAYFVESNMGGFPTEESTMLYRSSAAVAEYSRHIATEMYGDQRHFGYVYGGSGGGFKTMGCIENTKGVWDGAVPYVIGTPMSMPYSFTVRAHAMRILRDVFPQIADAVQPGSNRSPYDQLTLEQRQALLEVTKMGFPPENWVIHDTIGDGALSVLAPAVYQTDPEYFSDFWEKAGYLGAEADSSARRDRIIHRTRISAIHTVGVKEQQIQENTTGVDTAWLQRFAQQPDSNIVLELQDALPKNAYLEGSLLRFVSGKLKGKALPFSHQKEREIELSGGEILQAIGGEAFGKVAVGDEIVLDNSDYIALQTYHRHQLPDSSYAVWDQFRDAYGQPAYPQRELLLGPILAQSASGSLQSGRFDSKMIVVSALQDESALPWQTDWYCQTVKAVLGDKLEEQFRVWFIDHSLHGDSEKSPDSRYFVGYIGALHQALLDLSDWVERGVAPCQSTCYQLKDGQVFVPPAATDRKGIQPVVELTVNQSQRVECKMGDTITATAVVEMPPQAGKLVSFAWDAEGSGVFTEVEEMTILENGTAATISLTHTYQTKGTFFPVVRASAQREGIKNQYTTIQNIGRMRVVCG